MMLGDETDLARGRTRRIDNEMGLDQGLGGKRPHQGAAGFILADDADENAARSEAGNVARDVARAADGRSLRVTARIGAGASGEMRRDSP
jgi:hypothetical protein